MYYTAWAQRGLFINYVIVCKVQTQQQQQQQPTINDADISTPTSCKHLKHGDKSFVLYKKSATQTNVDSVDHENAATGCNSG